MKRLQILAVVGLLAVPSAGRAQSLNELLEAHDRATNASRTYPGDIKDWNDWNDWNAYNRAGWRAVSKGYYDTAEHEFLSAIKAAKRPSINDPRLIARSYSDYAWAVQKQGRHAEAEPLARWAMETRISLLEPQSPVVAQSHNQMGMLYYELGRFAEAETLLRRTIEAQAKAPKPSRQEHSRSHTLIGLLMVAQRRYAESEPFFLQAIAIREKGYGRSHLETGDALNNLAWAYLEQGKEDLALPLFERARRIFEQGLGSTHPSLAHVLHGLAQIGSKSDNHIQTEAYFRAAVEIWDVADPGGTGPVIEVLKHYSAWLEKLGRADDAGRIKARLAPAREKSSMNSRKASDWYRLTDPSPGVAPPPPRLSS